MTFAPQPVPQFDFCPFPPVGDSDGFGPLYIGGRLSTDWLIAAYANGIFPWPFEWRNGDMLAWFSPDPRAILEFDSLHVSRRLLRRLRRGEFQFTINQAFEKVLAGCAAPRADQGTWLTPEMIAAYVRFHRAGFAHSVEVWQDDQLVGGTYGVAMGRCFSAESMFHTAYDASKAAVVHLVEHLRATGFEVLDIQQMSSHMKVMGAHDISRREYLARIRRAHFNLSRG